MSQVTEILTAVRHGNTHAAEELLPLVYQELRQLAAQMLAREKSGHTLQPTALVHEAWLRLAGDGEQTWDNRRHFFAAAAEAMRRILVESARRKRRVKHGGEFRRVNLPDVELSTAVPPDEILALNEALERLAEEDPVKAELVKLRYFAGLTLDETAAALGISRATASRYWTYARAWLYDRVRGEEDAL